MGFLTKASDISAIKTAVEIIDNFISGNRGLVTEDSAAAIKAAAEIIDNFIAGSRGLVTEDNSAAILANLNITLSALRDAIRGSGTKDFTTLETLLATALIRDITKIGGTAQTGRDWSTDFKGLSSLIVDEVRLLGITGATYFTPALVTTGSQGSDQITLAAGAAEGLLWQGTYTPLKTGTLLYVVFVINYFLKSSAATQAKTHRMQGTSTSTQVALQATVSENLTTAFVLKSALGIFPAVTNFNAVPFTLGLYGTPSADENIVGYLDGSSVIWAVYKGL